MGATLMRHGLRSALGAELRVKGCAYLQSPSYDGHPVRVDCGPMMCWVTIKSDQSGTWMRWREEGQPSASRSAQI